MSATVFGTAAVLGFHAHSAATPIATAAPTSTAATPAPAGSTTATGDAMNTRYGPAQVKVTVLKGKIVSIEAVQLQSADQKSQLISGRAAPVLQQSALAKQSAAVDTVSGATYTSLSYEASLQSALDKVSYKAPDGSTASTDVSQLQ
jgi:uncharacterized protein with FMN-binding domain